MKILVDENGYKQFFDELERLKKHAEEIAAFGSESCEDAVGDGWHDNFAFEESVRESRKLAQLIDNMLNKQKDLEIIKDNKKEAELVNLYDVIDIKIKYSEDDEEDEVIKLTGKYIPNIEGNIKEVSLNSPLGKALYKSKVGSEVFYNVGNIKIKVFIKSKK